MSFEDWPETSLQLILNPQQKLASDQPIIYYQFICHSCFCPSLQGMWGQIIIFNWGQESQLIYFSSPVIFIPLHPQNVFLSKSPENKPMLENKAKLIAFVLLSTLLKIEWQIAQYDNDGNRVKIDTFNFVIWVYVNSQWGQKCVFFTLKKTHMVTFPWELYRAKHQPLYVTVGLQNLLLCCSQLWPCAEWTYAAHQSMCHCRRLLELSRSDGSWGTSSTYSPDFAGRPCHSDSKQNSWGLFNNTTLTLFLSGKEEQRSNWEAATFTTSTS